MKRWKMIFAILLLSPTYSAFSLDFSSFCFINLANFNYKQQQSWASNNVVKDWAPERTSLQLDPSLQSRHYYLINFSTPMQWQSAKANNSFSF